MKTLLNSLVAGLLISLSVFADERYDVTDRDTYRSLPVEEVPVYDRNTQELTGWSKTGNGVYCIRTVNDRYYCEWQR